MNPITSFIHRHPWIYIVFAFLLLIAAWSSLITIAAKYSPQVIEVKRSR